MSKPKTCEFGQHHFLEVFVQCTFGWTSWTHNAQVCLQCRSDPLAVSGSRRFGRCGGTRTHHQSVHECHDDSFSKPDGGVRGIATGTSFRRLVAKTLARQFMKVVESTCAPFQFALSTRAGTDCVGHTIRAMTDDDPECIVLSIDGSAHMTTFC